jgi:hypothetical protein
MATYRREYRIEKELSDRNHRRTDTYVIKWLKNNKDRLHEILEPVISEGGYGHLLTVLGAVSKCISNASKDEYEDIIDWKELFVILNVRSNKFIMLYLDPLFREIAHSRKKISDFGLSEEHPIMKYVSKYEFCIRKPNLWEYQTKKNEHQFRFNMKTYELSYENVIVFIDWIYNCQIFDFSIPKRHSRKHYRQIVKDAGLGDEYLTCDVATYFSNKPPLKSKNDSFMREEIIISDNEEKNNKRRRYSLPKNMMIAGLKNMHDTIEKLYDFLKFHLRNLIFDSQPIELLLLYRRVYNNINVKRLLNAIDTEVMMVKNVFYYDLFVKNINQIMAWINEDIDIILPLFENAVSLKSKSMTKEVFDMLKQHINTYLTKHDIVMALTRAKID